MTLTEPADGPAAEVWAHPAPPPTPATQAAPATWAAWEARHTGLVRRAGLALVLFGLAWRVFRYLMGMPIWGDEAMLLVNYQTRSFADVFGPIEYCQIAPLLFHWAEMAVVQTLGSSEWAVRLPALLGSLVGFGLFALLARLTLTPLPRAVAVGVLAVAIWPATNGSLVKPYSWDLTVGTAFLIPFAAWRLDRTRRWPLVVLCALAPVGLTASYPAVFVAGAVGLALLRPVLRSGDRRQQALLLTYGLLAVATFLLHYELVGKPHLATVTFGGHSTAEGMHTYWAKAFPPADPAKLLVWLPSTLAGEIAAYPIGGQRGLSFVTVTLCAIGAVGMWRRKEGDLVAVLLGVLGLWLAAAALHKYPIGSCRLGQHAAPVFCLLGAAGTADLLRRWVPVTRARQAVIGVAILLGLVGLGGLARDLIRPYRDLEARDSRAAVRALTESTADPILVAQPRVEVPTASVHWYLGTHGDRVMWAPADWVEAVRGKPAVWVVACGDPPAGDEEGESRDRLGPGWVCVTRYLTNVTGKGPPDLPTFRAYLFRCAGPLPP